LRTVKRPASNTLSQRASHDGRQVEESREFTKHEGLEDEHAPADAIEGERPGLPSALVGAVCERERSVRAKIKVEGERRLTVDEEEFVLVDEVGDTEVQGGEGEDERRDNRVGHAQRPDEQRL
jgi:hypothetical protein